MIKAVGLWVLLAFATGPAHAPPAFRSTSGPVPAAVAERMRQHSWRQGCPVPIEELAYLRLSHFGYDGEVHEGELIVHQEVAAEVQAIFKALFAQRFPVEKMRPIDDYQGDDDRSMADNNTSGFNCRPVAGKPLVFSKHSQGRAIDVNPLVNPMLASGTVAPPAGAEYANRKKKAPGILRDGESAVREFTRRGWTWGGSWLSMKDYQHFEK
jgi:hypothetical protein